MTAPLREAPEALLQALDDAIVGQRTSVLLASDDGQALDTCGRALLRRLRQHDGLDTSVLYDMDRQLLVERFNRLLESMSIDEARRAERGAARAQVWLLQIQAAEGIAQAQLLIRLAQEFPGAGVTLVLLAPDAVGRALAESIGRGLRVWRLEAAPAPAGPSLADALAAGPADEPPAVLDVPPARAAAGEGAEASGRGARAGRQAAPGSPSARGGATRWLLRGILALFVITAVAVSWLLVTQRGRPASPAPTAPAVPPASAPPVAPPAASEPAPAPPPDGSAATPPADAAPTPAAPSPTPPAPAPALSPAAPAPTPPTAPTPAPASSAPGAILGEGARWAAELDPAAWVVQHLVLDSPTAVADWRNRHAGLASSQIVAIRRPRSEARAYALVSGPFASAADARAFLARPGVPPDHWMRRASGLQGDLDRSALATASAN